MSFRRAPDRRRQAALRMIAALLLTAAGSVAARAQATSPSPPAAPLANPGSPAPAAPAPLPSPQPAPVVGTPATVVDDKQIGSVLGKAIQGPKGDDMGRIVDVLIDRTGDVRAAVVDFGGFFGVGSRKIAVDWHSLHFKTGEKEDTIVADLPPDELRTAPVYKEGEPVVIVGGGRAPAPAAPAPAEPAAK